MKLRVMIFDHRTYCLNSLGDSLAQLGHSIAFQSSWRQDEAELGMRMFQPHILLTVGYNRRLFSGFADCIPELCSKYGVFHLYWATEDRINHYDWSLPYIKRTKPQLVWTIHRDCVQAYRNLGIPASYLNFGFNPRIFPWKPLPLEFSIAMVAATHIFKETFRFESFRLLLAPLAAAGYHLDIWGAGWQRKEHEIQKLFGFSLQGQKLHGHMPYGDTSRIYRSSGLTLGIQNAQDQVSQRTFEILGSGALMLAPRTPVLEEMFEDRRELLLSGSPEETVELAQYYLPRLPQARKIGEQARKKILEQYTYHQQLAQVLPQLQDLLTKHRRDVNGI